MPEQLRGKVSRRKKDPLRTKLVLRPREEAPRRRRRREEALRRREEPLTTEEHLTRSEKLTRSEEPTRSAVSLPSALKLTVTPILRWPAHFGRLDKHPSFLRPPVLHLAHKPFTLDAL